jgi:hypothetical protein
MNSLCTKLFSKKINKIQSEAETVNQDKINTIKDRNAKIKSLIKETSYSFNSYSIFSIRCESRLGRLDSHRKWFIFDK